MKHGPCYECQDRQVGCHAKCERYKKYRDELDEDKRQKIINSTWTVGFSNRIKKRLKYKK